MLVRGGSSWVGRIPVLVLVLLLLRRTAVMLHVLERSRASEAILVSAVCDRGWPAFGAASERVQDGLVLGVGVWTTLAGTVRRIRT